MVFWKVKDFLDQFTWFSVDSKGICNEIQINGQHKKQVNQKAINLFKDNSTGCKQGIVNKFFKSLLVLSGERL